MQYHPQPLKLEARINAPRFREKNEDKTFSKIMRLIASSRKKNCGKSESIIR